MKQKGQVRYAKRCSEFTEKMLRFYSEPAQVFTNRCSGFLAEVQTIN